MPPKRSSIAALLGFVALIAFGCAALHEASAPWAFTLLGIEYLALFSAPLGAILRTGTDRGFWLGFALFGWGFILLSSGYLSLADGRPFVSRFAGADEETAPILTPFEITHELLDQLALWRSAAPPAVGEEIQVSWRGVYYAAKVREIKQDQFQIRYTSDPGGTYDEWVGFNRIRTHTLSYYYCIGNSIAVLIVGCLGGTVARCLQRSELRTRAQAMR